MRALLSAIATLLMVTISAMPLLAQSGQAPAEGKEADEVKPGDQGKSLLNTEFGGVNFGAGFSLTLDTGSQDRVEEAVIDDLGYVRVSKRGNSVARIMLEMHYFFTPRQGRYGIGPFMAIQPGSNEIISSIGGGLMFGMRKADSAKSFNFGFGRSADPSARVLGAGLKENEKAPLNAEGKPTPIRYVQDDQFGWLFLFSFGW